jgi:hypothetical protein
MSNQLQDFAKPGQTRLYKVEEGSYLSKELDGKTANVIEVFLAKVCRCGSYVPHPAQVFVGKQ